jgi:hypothetical protein
MYVNEFASLRSINSNPLDAANFQCLYVSTNNVAQYMNACSELASYTLPLTYKWYLDLSSRGVILGLLNSVLERVQRPVNGTAFTRVFNVFVGNASERYTFLLGSKKSDDRRVISFVNAQRIDFDVGYSSASLSPDVSRARKVTFSFNKSKSTEPSSEFSGTSSADTAQQGNTSTISHSDVNHPKEPDDSKDSFGLSMGEFS